MHMLRTIGVGAFLVLALLALAGCGGGQQLAKLDHPREITQPSGGGFAGLPGLPAADAQARTVQAAGNYQFAVGDVQSMELASFEDDELVLQHDGLSYAILGANGGGNTPAAFKLEGTCNGCYVGVSDYARGCWRWIGGPYQDGAQITLPAGQWCNTGGSFYFAVVCPDGVEARLIPSATLAESADWNVLVWVAGDNNLAQDAVNDLNEMESVGSTEHVRVLAGYDIDVNSLSAPVAGTDAVHFIKVVQDSNDDSINVAGDPANQSFARAGYNSADPANLANFITWAEANFPAQHTMLVLWDHGNGWLPGDDGVSGPPPAHGVSAILSDDTDGDWDSTGNTFIAAALASRHFDILGFDACNMGQIEALYDFRSLADYYIASQVTEPNAGWNYTYLLQQWGDNYPLSNEQIGSTTVEGFRLYYETYPEEATLATYSQDELDTLVAALHDLAAAVTAKAAGEADVVKAAIIDAYEPAEGDGCRDLGGFLGNYVMYTSDTEITAKIAAAQEAYDAAVGSFGQVMQPDCSGLCAWLPSTDYFTPDYKEKYGELAFDQATGWLAMLEACGVPEGGGGGEEWKTPLVAWQPGYKIKLTFDNPQDEISPSIEDPNYNYGTPEEPDELAGIIEFSESSTVSGVAEETAELLPGAPAGGYWLNLQVFLGSTDTAHFVLLDASDTQVYDFGTIDAVDELGEASVAYLYYNDGNISEATWEPGDYVKIEWSDPLADFFLEVEAPDGGFGSPGMMFGMEDSIQFSPDSLESGLPWESATLLPTASHGIFVISACYNWYDGELMPPLIDVTFKLYDAMGQLKQDLSTISYPADELGADHTGVVLTY
jgi:hypothetical protein